jgi:uncharacterized protein (DUF58 family)
VTVAERPGATTAFSHQGPGDLTLASIVLFTLGAYGVAAGAATGEEAVVAVGVFAFTLFVVGIVWPVASIARLEVEVVAPPDASVGDTVPLRLKIGGHAPRLDVRVLDPAGVWLRTAAPASGELLHVAARRGVFHYVRVQLRTSAPLGVFVRTRTLRVELGFPTTVAPRPTSAAPMLQPIPDHTTTATVPAFAGGAGDTVRAVRPYVAGDPARLVHWPTSARRGELVVREYDPPPALGIALVVDLRGQAVEAAASQAMGIGIATIAAGGVVCCCTHEEDGPVTALVTDALTFGRLLARAIPGEPGEPLPGWPVEIVRS